MTRRVESRLEQEMGRREPSPEFAAELRLRRAEGVGEEAARVKETKTVIEDTEYLRESILSENTRKAFDVVIGKIEQGKPVSETELKEVKDQISGQALNHTRGMLGEHLANEFAIEVLKEAPDGVEAFLSGHYHVSGRLNTDKFLAHQDSDGKTVVIDKVIEVKAFAASPAKMESQIEDHLAKIRRTGVMNIDGYETPVRVSSDVEKLTVAPADVEGVTHHLPLSSQEISIAVENAIHDALTRHYPQESLNRLYKEMRLRDVITQTQAEKYRRILVGPM